MTGFGKSLALIGVATLMGFAPMARAVAGDSEGQAPTASERAKIESILREYLLAHPEVIPEAMERLRDRQMATLVNANRKQLETPYSGAWAGNEHGDVTLVMFFDYACHYCRQSLPDVRRLLREDNNLKIVFRELPILGPESGVAARYSLAAAEQGKYLEFHDGLFAAGGPSKVNIDGVGRAMGLDNSAAVAAIAKPAIQQELDHNFQLAQNMGLTGTPAWVVGNEILKGAVGYEVLKSAIAKTRNFGLPPV